MSPVSVAFGFGWSHCWDPGCYSCHPHSCYMQIAACLDASACSLQLCLGPCMASLLWEHVPSCSIMLGVCSLFYSCISCTCIWTCLLSSVVTFDLNTYLHSDKKKGHRESLAPWTTTPHRQVSFHFSSSSSSSSSLGLLHCSRCIWTVESELIHSLLFPGPARAAQVKTAGSGPTHFKKIPKIFKKRLWLSRVFFYPFWLISVCIFIP